MFTAMIVVCLMGVPECQGFVDTYGPYKTEAECKSRVEKMAVDMQTILSKAYPGRPAQIRLMCKADQEA
jgi:hypothetical protein